MATQVQFRRGTATQNNNFTGAEGELSVNLSNYALRLHDGATAGGYEIARADMSNAVYGATVLPSLNTTYNLGSSAYRFLNVYSDEFTGDLTGNADTATTLQTARTINGVSFDGSADITIEASIDKTLFISEGLEDSGGGTQFDGGTDVTLRLKNAPNFTNNTVLRWDDTNTQFVDSTITDDGTTVTISGNLNVTGTTTTISTTNLEVTDKLIVIGDGTTTTQAADGAGFNIGTSGVSLTYDLANTSWTSSESFNLSTGKTYKIAGTTVIGSTSLGTGIVSSSLTSVGTLTSLTVSGLTNTNGLISTNGIGISTGNLNLTDTNTLSGEIFAVGRNYWFGHINDNTATINVNIGGKSNATVKPAISQLSFGVSQTGTSSYIQSTPSGLLIKSNTSGNFFRLDAAGAGVELQYNGDTKLITTSAGVKIYNKLEVEEVTLRDHDTSTDVATTIVKYGDTSTSSLGDHNLTMDSWEYATYNAAEYTVTSQSVDGKQEITKLTVMANDAGDIYVTEQNTMRTDENNPTTLFQLLKVSSDILVLIKPVSPSNDITYKMTGVRYFA